VDCDEPEESVFHLLAYVLMEQEDQQPQQPADGDGTQQKKNHHHVVLTWESGFRELRNLYHTLVANRKRSTNVNPHSTPVYHHENQRTLARRAVTRAQHQRLQQLLQRRARGEPIQYLVGQWDFLEWTFAVQAPLLCPRPETEELVLRAWQKVVRPLMTQYYNDENRRIVRILDVGCGTGCIGISLLALAIQQAPDPVFPNVFVTALDVDPVACEVSRANARRIVSPFTVHYLVHHIGAADYHHSPGDYDLVISNPPYIPPGEMEGLARTVKEYENFGALCGGTSHDGMDVIRQILPQLPHWLRVGGECWMEVHPTQPALLRDLLSSSFAAATTNKNKRVEFVETMQDLQGKDRFVRLRIVPLAETGVENE